MKLSEIKSELKKLTTIAFQLPNGELVATHFHVTEVGKISKHFIDCGGTVRTEETANFQLWEANDYNHRLHPEKLLHIIELSESKLQMPDLEIEIEYQMKETIGKFSLGFDGTNFLLTSKATDCLAKSDCGLPTEKTKTNLNQVASCCQPNTACC